MIIISAMSEDRVIGSGNGMPWNVPVEYDQYLQFVARQTVIMGRKSFDIFGSDLPEGTSPIVISRSVMIDGVHVVKSLAEALTLAGSLGNKVFVAGGASIYTQAVPLAREMYLSTIKGAYEGDAYFPEFDADDWQVTEERNESEFVFRQYRRIRETT